MNVSEFTFQIIVLFIPGFITFLIVEALTTHRDIATPRMLLYSLTFGFLGYLFYYPLTLVPALGLEFTLTESLRGGGSEIDFKQIIVLTILAVPLGLAISTVVNKYWIHRLAAKLGASRKFGDADVWSFTMNRKANDWWAVVRDLDDDLIYEGWIVAFSDTTDLLDEILLRNVKVYRNSTGEELYHVSAVYLSNERGKKVIEFPIFDSSDRIEEGEQA